jgi:hypothetical protein
MRVLLIPPLGDTPWASQQSLVDSLRANGHTVDVADTAGGTFPHPAAYDAPPGASVSLPRFFAGRAKVYVRFLRELRRALKRDHYDIVLTWHPFWATATRAVRPDGTRVAWVMPERRAAMRRTILERLGSSLFVDTLIVPHGRTTLANIGRQVIAAPIDDPLLTPASDLADAGAWVVFSRPEPAMDAVVMLSAQSRLRSAAAVIVDGRGGDGAYGNHDVLLQAACGAEQLDMAIDAGWVTRHRPEFVIDPVASLDLVDHRHRAAFQAGIPVRLPASEITSAVAHLVDVVPGDGWVEVRPRLPAPRDVAQWAADAVRDPVFPRWEFVAQHGKPVDECPVCRSANRVEQQRVQRSTTVFRCASCGLRYASPKVPDDLVYTTGYHDGSGLFGSDYAEAAWYFDALSDARLDYIAAAGATPRAGRLVDLGTGLGHFVRRAQAHGWDADGLEISPDAVAFARRELGIELIEGTIEGFRPDASYAVATLGQTLEHFTRPGDVLDHIREHILMPRGWLYVELPHIDGLPRRLRRANWAHWQSGDHVSFFTRRDLRNLMEAHGFDVVACETITYTSPGAIGALYTLGLFDATTSWGSAIRIATRVARTRLPFVPRALMPVTAADLAPDSPAERGLKAIARGLDRAGLGDHIRIVVRAR